MRRTTQSRLLFFTLLGALLLVGVPASTGCEDPTPGDGDGDSGDGDGDGDNGDGDGDNGNGDGDGDSGDGDGDGDSGDGDGDGDAIPDPPFKTSSRGKLVWKRTATLEADLMGALALDKQEVCNELGLFNCATNVHLVALGGNEPFVKALYEPLTSPSVTTSVAVDRIVLAACSAAAERDAGGPAEVFTALDLGEAAVSEGTAVDETITALYRRFHARDPLEEELDEVRTLTVDDDGAAVSTLDFAKLSCFAVGTTSEMVFY